jgi:iron complex outermembrane receptor protein
MDRDFGQRRLRARRFALSVLVLISIATHADAQTLADPSALRELSFDQLANIAVMSVSRFSEPLAQAPASIYVISASDIRRAGAASLAEALRLAPNLQVARIDAGQYAISARGFNGLASNKLLVLVDGRTIYTPLFSGVFWDQQDVVVEDIDRIEVISGPAATLWGINAVNGVINVITRSASDTHGTVVSAAVGSREQQALLRVGTSFAQGGHVRAYGKFTHRENNVRANRTRVRDARDWLQAGFRADWLDDDGGITIQGDAYGVRTEDRGLSGAGVPIGRAELSGVNLLGRWTRRLRDGAEMHVQAYVDHADRNERILFQPASTLYDVEFQHGLTSGRHRLVWGAGYRHGTDQVEDGFLVGFRPTSRDLNWAHAYGQDSVQLGHDLELSAGIKFDRNDYTGWELQPDARLAWTPSAAHLVWGAVSRAARAPARFDRDVIRPLGGVAGGPNFVAEVANVFQLGYRGRAGDAVTWSITSFLHRWDRLRSATTPPVLSENRIEGPVYGVEGWALWQPLPAWRLTGGLSTFRKNLRLEAGSTDPLGPRNPQLSNDPDYLWMARSSINVGRHHDLDASVRGVGRLPNPVVPAYTAVDARYAWRVRPSLELSLLGQNLFDESHPEFNALPGRSEFERSLLLRATWSR